MKCYAWLAGALYVLALWQAPARAAAPDPVLLSFASVGDSRADPESATTAQDRVYLQNTRALARILREIQAQRPTALFFNGDMIMGYGADRAMIISLFFNGDMIMDYGADRATLYRQYAYWRGMVAALMESGTYVVPVPGNHEVQHKFVDDAGRTIKQAQVGNEQLWRENMGDLILDLPRWQAVTGTSATAFDAGHAPQPGAADGIQTLQQQLSYSFDVGRSHFAVINTDPVGNDGHAPVQWLAHDFAQARARGATRFFVFGHKPAYTYYYRAGVAPDGLDIFPDHAAAFWAVIERYQGMYFCGHQHIFHASQPAAAQGGRAWQVMVGSGGSPFSAGPGASRQPQDRMYAWALVRLHASGKVRMQVYGFDEHYGATRLLKSLNW